MPKHWLQIKGDPMVRAFLFQQRRVDSLFDLHLDAVHDVVARLLTEKGVFHAKIHYSSGQLTCWFSYDAYRYRVYHREEVLAPEFLAALPDVDLEHLKPLMAGRELPPVLAEFRRLRLTDDTLYLRNGSVNMVNGMIGMTFSCDGAHYIDYRTFFEQLKSFGAETAPDVIEAAPA